MLNHDFDHYEAYYADKLWNLLPAVYRAEDTDIFNQSGPLREMVNRLGVQAAILRRSMDRMWEDQSIETCDDWVIAYIGDLLNTRLVASLDGRGQRLDVAKTIYYRRRAGTVAILEEIATNITGWNARVVEFFRRLSRTRHNFDPEIGLPSATDTPTLYRTLQQAQGLIGSLTKTSIGGWADLRNVYGAAKTHSAFDEFFYTADFRQGRDQVGWHNIPRLGVFIWRLYSFLVGVAINPALSKTVNQGIGVTPVESHQCPGHYTFDPTGREIPLFAAASRTFGNQWVSPAEWQLPVEISIPLLAAELKNLYAAKNPADDSLLYNSLGVFNLQGELIPVAQVTADPDNVNIALLIDPQHGKLIKRKNAPTDAVLVTYHYGFSSMIGAGPFDRRILGLKTPVLPSAINPVTVTGGADALVSPLGTIAPTGTLTIQDSLTYNKVSNVTGLQHITLRAENKTRPLIRLPVPTPPNPTPTTWVFTGTESSHLVLEGLFISGGDIVLKGKFDSVTLTCCTFDPGTSGDAQNPPTVYAKSIDNRDLIPCRLWIEAEVRQMTIDRCITGPIRTRANGEIQTLTITDSIVQAIRTSNFGLFDITNLQDSINLVIKLRDAHTSLSGYLKSQFPVATQQLLNQYNGVDLPSSELQQALITGLNALVSGPLLYDPQRFQQVRLTPATQKLIGQNTQGAELIRLNRLLLEEAYPLELADKAFALSNGEVNLSRCTLLGSAYLHRLDASECILDDILVVEDMQHGCVRFSAWATGSVLPRPYESVEIAPRSPLFNTRVFGYPAYAQLSKSVDTAILSKTAGATIAEGAENGSEMGAFAREKNPIKERSLRLKYEEFMPLGLVPVIIYVT